MNRLHEVALAIVLEGTETIDLRSTSHVWKIFTVTIYSPIQGGWNRRDLTFKDERAAFAVFGALVARRLNEPDILSYFELESRLNLRTEEPR